MNCSTLYSNLCSYCNSTYEWFFSIYSDLTKKIDSLWLQFASNQQNTDSNSLLDQHIITVVYPTTTVDSGKKVDNEEVDNEEEFFDCFETPEDLNTNPPEEKKTLNSYTKDYGGIHYILQEKGCITFYPIDDQTNHFLFVSEKQEKILFPLPFEELKESLHNFSIEITSTSLNASRDYLLSIPLEKVKEILMEKGLSFLPLPDPIFLYIPKNIPVTYKTNNGRITYQFPDHQVAIKDETNQKIIFVKGLEYTSEGLLVALDLQTDWWCVSTALVGARLWSRRKDGWITLPPVEIQDQQLK